MNMYWKVMTKNYWPDFSLCQYHTHFYFEYLTSLGMEKIYGIAYFLGHIRSQSGHMITYFLGHIRFLYYFNTEGVVHKSWSTALQFQIYKAIEWGGNNKANVTAFFQQRTILYYSGKLNGYHTIHKIAKVYRYTK